jgi:hypothetical protein
MPGRARARGGAHARATPRPALDAPRANPDDDRAARYGRVAADRDDGAGPGPGAGRLDRWYVREVAVAWVTARVVVAAALGLVHFLVGSVADSATTTGTAGVLRHTGLLGWDAGWYQTIAEHGYAGAGAESRRFFPLLPLLVRGIAAAPGLGAHAGLVLVALVNVLAFALGLLLVQLARVEGFDAATTRRVIWLSALAPPAFVLVMGYSEALAMLLAVAVFLGARTGRWELAALAGIGAGLCRPLGLLLVLPVAIEAARGLGAANGPNRLRRALAVVAPGIGAAGYLAWSAATYGDGLAPLTLQRDAARHGSTGDPLRVLWDAAQGTLHGQLGTGLHVPWLLLAVVGLVVMVRRLPASYPAWCAAVLVTVLTGSNLDSSERYLFAAFPFVFVAALVTGRRTVWPGVLALSATTMTVYATLAFTLSYVP